MKVKELRQLLNEVPDGFTQQQFDDFPVNFSVDGMNFESPCECESGHVSFRGSCYENGELIPEEKDAEDINIFILMPHGITDKLIESGSISIEDANGHNSNN